MRRGSNPAETPPQLPQPPPNPGTAAMSPQQIMRARYKQQMMPPRTWKQQQARQQQLEAISRSKVAQNRNIYTAAAALAARESSGSASSSSTAVNKPSPTRTTSTTSAASANSTSSQASGSSQGGAGTGTGIERTARRASASSISSASSNQPNNLQARRRSSTSSSSVSIAAAVAAQHSQSQPNSPQHATQQQQQQSQTNSPLSRHNSVQSLQQLSQHAQLSQRHNSLQSQRPHRDSMQDLHSQQSQTSVQRIQLTRKSSQTPSQSSSINSPTSPVDTRQHSEPPQQQQAQGSQQQGFGRGIRSETLLPRPSTTSLQTTAPTSPRRSMHASAAARASANNPIDVAPRVPLSAKFVSTLTQALRSQQEERRRSADLEEMRRQEMIRRLEGVDYSAAIAASSSPGTPTDAHSMQATPTLTRRSTETTRSAASTTSAASGTSSVESAATTAALVAPYALTGDAFAEHQQQLYQKQQQQAERRRRAAEKSKTSALHAAVAAGGRVEADIACIDRRTHEAFQNALQQKRRGRGALMRKYNPVASWSSPARILRTQQLPHQQQQQQQQQSPSTPTTPSLEASTPTTNAATPAIPVPAMSLPRRSTSSSLPMAAGSQVSLESTGSTSSLASLPAGSPVTTGMFPHSMRSGTSRTSVRNRHSLPPPLPAHTQLPASVPRSHHYVVHHHTQVPPQYGHLQHAKSASSSSSSLVQSPVDPQDVINSSLLGVEKVPLKSQPVPQTKMPMSLRGPESRKRFNEDKPWKGHRELTSVSDRERKRYEPLWAANRDVHLPYIYVPERYEQAWQEAIAEELPQLVQGKPGGGTTKRTAEGVRHRSSNTSLDRQAPVQRSTTNRSSSSTTSASGSGGVVSSSSRSMRSFHSAYSSIDERVSHQLPTVKPTRASELTDLDSDEHSDTMSVPGLVHSDTEDLKLETEEDEDDETDATAEDYDSTIMSTASAPAEIPAEGEVDIRKELEKRRDEVHGYVVARLWRRSKLPEETLAQIWDLVDTNKDGTLERSGFTVGMWLCDQCLYGRKLPQKVPPEVWQSVGRLNLKIRVKPKRSKIGYVRKLPRFFGNAVGYTMHGGRQAIKKAVHTATK